jgi:hypothetical protein
VTPQGSVATHWRAASQTSLACAAALRLIPLPAGLVGKLLRCGGGMIKIETFERGRPNSREQGGYLNFEGVRIAHRSGLVPAFAET